MRVTGSSFLVYALCEPDTGESVRYVGRSSRGLTRPKQHLNPSRSKHVKTHTQSWITHLREQGKLPLIKVLGVYESFEQSCTAEIDAIEIYKALGANLTNHATGGKDGAYGRKCGPEELAKRALRPGNRTGTKQSPEAVEKMRLSKIGKPQPHAKALILACIEKCKVPVQATHKKSGEVLVFASITDARKSGFNASSCMFKSLSTPGQLYKGYQWERKKVSNS